MCLILSGRINIWRTFYFDAFEWCHRILPAAGLMNGLSRGDLTNRWKQTQNLASLNKTYLNRDKVTTGNLVLPGAPLFQLSCHILEISFSSQIPAFSLENFHLTIWFCLKVQKILPQLVATSEMAKHSAEHGPFSSCQAHCHFPLVCVCFNKKEKKTKQKTKHTPKFTTF